MAVRNLTDGRYTYDSMKPCPFCGKPVAIEYTGYNRSFRVTHVDWNEECPLMNGIMFHNNENNNYHVAIEMWNQRCES